MAEAQGYDYKLAASGEHMFDGYDKEPCLILDDFRASDMKFSDFLKLLDPHHDSDVAARYHNRNMSNLKLLAITNTQAPNTIYKFFQDANSAEPANQFYRRLSYTYYEIVIVDKLHPYLNTIYEYIIVSTLLKDLNFSLKKDRDFYEEDSITCCFFIFGCWM